MAVDQQQVAAPAGQKRQRVAEAAVAELALEQRLPHYAVSRHAPAAFDSGSSTGGSSAARPFASLLLAPATLVQPPEAAALAASCGMEPELRRLLLPAGPLHGQPWQQQQHGGSSAAAPAAAGASAEPRYFGAAAGAAPAAGDAGQLWTRQYEQLLQQQPEDEQLWLAYAVRHAVEARRAGAGAGSGAVQLAPGEGESAFGVLAGTTAEKMHVRASKGLNARGLLVPFSFPAWLQRCGRRCCWC